MKALAKVARFVRWRDWGPGKVTLLCSLCFYIAVAYHLLFAAFALTFVVFLIFASAQSALGFVLNDWGDRDLDRQQGKPNVFLETSSRQGVLGLGMMLSVAFVSGLPLVWRPGFTVLWLVWVVLAAFYSLEPIRLKTHGIAGLICSFIAQWLLPVLIAFAAFGQFGGFDMWLLALALTMSGATLEIGHQRRDRQCDASTQARTFAVSRSASDIDRTYAVAVVLDKLAIGLVVTVATLALFSISNWWSFAIAAGIGTAYLALLIYTLPAALHALNRGAIQDPYYSEGRSGAKLLHETVPNLALPIALATAAAIRAPQYAILLILFGVWRLVLGSADWRWPLRAVQKWR